MIAWDVVVWGLWGALFLVAEGLALSKKVPWSTLSEFVWITEHWIWPLRAAYAVGLLVLMVHFVTG